MSKKLKEENTENVLSEFVNYWNCWHEEWLKLVNPKQKKIKGWIIPKKKIDFAATEKKMNGSKKKKDGTFKEVLFKKKIEIFRAIPEPHWIHNDLLDNIHPPKAVFININPGPPKFYHLRPDNHQDFFKNNKKEKNNNEIKPLINWIQLYEDKGSYSNFISALIVKYSESTDFWHYKNRVQWLNDYNTNNKATIKDIATFELTPWHTNAVSEIKKEWFHDSAITDYIMKPAICLAKKIDGLLKNRIISRGKRDEWVKLFSSQKLKKEWKKYEDCITFGGEGPNSVYYTVIFYNKQEKVYFINFSGPQTMKLPKLDKQTKIYYGSNVCNIIELLNNPCKYIKTDKP